MLVKTDHRLHAWRTRSRSRSRRSAAREAPGAAGRGGDRAQHPAPRARDRARVARARRASRRAAVGRGLRLRPAARLRLRERADRASGCRAGDLPLALFAFNVGVELGQLAFVAARAPPRALVPPPRDSLAALGRGAAGLRRRNARGVLDDPADGDSLRMGQGVKASRALSFLLLAALPGRRLRPHARRRGDRASRGARAPGVGPRSRPGDDRRRPVGRPARAAGRLAAAGDLSHGHGLRRNTRTPRRADPGHRGRHRALGDRPRRGGPLRGAAEARNRGRSSSDSSRSSTGTPTERSCPRGRTASSTASGSWSRPACSTPPASGSASSTAGRSAASHCAGRAPSWRSRGSPSSGGR